MQFFELKSRLKDFFIFSISDLKKIDPSFHNQRLSEWQKKGYIKKVRQGFYIFSDIQLDESRLCFIANTIYRPSYISLEMAFSIHHLIPEAVYAITSITTQKTSHFKTDMGHFSYRHIKPELFFGYALHTNSNYTYRVAEIEKAVLDYLYLNPHITQMQDFDGLRFNVNEFKETADVSRLQQYLKAFRSKALQTRVNHFLQYLNYA